MSDSNRRTAPRAAVAVLAEVECEDVRTTARTRDLSMSGVGLITERALREGADAALLLLLTNEGIANPAFDPLHLKCKVVWCAPQEGGTTLAGAHFESLTVSEEQELKRFIQTLE